MNKAITIVSEVGVDAAVRANTYHCFLGVSDRNALFLLCVYLSFVFCSAIT